MRRIVDVCQGGTRLGHGLGRQGPCWRLILCASQGNTDMGREERYKLVLRDNASGPNELYDLSIDPRETVDRFPDEHYLTIHQELADAISSWKLKYSS